MSKIIMPHSTQVNMLNDIMGVNTPQCIKPVEELQMGIVIALQVHGHLSIGVHVIIIGSTISCYPDIVHVPSFPVAHACIRGEIEQEVRGGVVEGRDIYGA